MDVVEDLKPVITGLEKPFVIGLDLGGTCHQLYKDTNL